MAINFKGKFLLICFLFALFYVFFMSGGTLANGKELDVSLYPEFYKQIENGNIKIDEKYYDNFFYYDSDFVEDYYAVVTGFYDRYNRGTFLSISVNDTPVGMYVFFLSKA